MDTIYIVTGCHDRIILCSVVWKIPSSKTSCVFYDACVPGLLQD